MAGGYATRPSAVITYRVKVKKKPVGHGPVISSSSKVMQLEQYSATGDSRPDI